jgi:hypothetical protein
MKKVGVLMIVIILFNFIFCNSTFAIPDDDDDDTSTTTVMTKDDYESITQEGTTSLETESGTTTTTISASDSSVGSTTGMLASVATPIFAVIKIAMDHMAINGGLYYVDSDYSASETKTFTICSLVFGEFLLFNGKIYETNETLNPDIERGNVAKLMDSIKEKALSMFNFLTTVALALALFLFVYSLIRVLAAASSLEMAAWKKVLGNWLLCLLFIFFAKYIIIILNVINDKILDMLWAVRTNLESQGYNNLETVLLTDSANSIMNSGGLTFFAYSIEYIVMIILELAFFIKYILRAFFLIFLTVAAPIIGILHAFNVMNGKDNSILRNWANQFTSLLFLQPIHGLIYIVFIFSISEIAINAPFVGIIFLYALYRAEKIVKLMLNMKDGISVSSLIKK